MLFLFLVPSILFIQDLIKYVESHSGRSLAWLGHRLPKQEGDVLEAFKDFLLMDLRQSERTVSDKIRLS